VDDFEKPSPPEGTQTLVDETLVPPVAWAFPLSLSLKGPEERVKSAGERLKKAATPTPEGDKGANGADGKKPAPEKAGTDAGAKPATPEPPANPQANPPDESPDDPADDPAADPGERLRDEARG
jgi:hypothetical protein